MKTDVWIHSGYICQLLQFLPNQESNCDKKANTEAIWKGTNTFFFQHSTKKKLVLPLKGVWWSYFLLFWILFYKLKFWDRGVKKSNETEENQRIPQLNFDSTAVVNSGHTLQNALKISTAFYVSAGCCLSTAQRRFLIFKMTEKLKTNNM